MGSDLKKKFFSIIPGFISNVSQHPNDKLQLKKRAQAFSFLRPQIKTGWASFLSTLCVSGSPDCASQDTSVRNTDKAKVLHEYIFSEGWARVRVGHEGWSQWGNGGLCPCESEKRLGAYYRPGEKCNLLGVSGQSPCNISSREQSEALSYLIMADGLLFVSHSACLSDSLFARPLAPTTLKCAN